MAEIGLQGSVSSSDQSFIAGFTAISTWENAPAPNSPSWRGSSGMASRIGIGSSSVGSMLIRSPPAIAKRTRCDGLRSSAAPPQFVGDLRPRQIRIEGKADQAA